MGNDKNITEGTNGKLYYGKGTKGGMATQPTTPNSDITRVNIPSTNEINKVEPKKVKALAELEKMQLAMAEGGQVTVLNDPTDDKFYFNIYINYMNKDSGKVETFDFDETYAVLNDLKLDSTSLNSEHLLDEDRQFDGDYDEYGELEKRLKDLLKVSELSIYYIVAQKY